MTRRLIEVLVCISLLGLEVYGFFLPIDGIVRTAAQNIDPCKNNFMQTFAANDGAPNCAAAQNIDPCKNNFMQAFAANDGAPNCAAAQNIDPCKNNFMQAFAANDGAPNCAAAQNIDPCKNNFMQAFAANDGAPNCGKNNFMQALGCFMNPMNFLRGIEMNNQWGANPMAFFENTPFLRSFGARLNNSMCGNKFMQTFADYMKAQTACFMNPMNFLRDIQMNNQWGTIPMKLFENTPFLRSFGVRWNSLMPKCLIWSKCVGLPTKCANAMKPSTCDSTKEESACHSSEDESTCDSSETSDESACDASEDECTCDPCKINKRSSGCFGTREEALQVKKRSKSDKDDDEDSEEIERAKRGIISSIAKPIIKYGLTGGMYPFAKAGRYFNPMAMMGGAFNPMSMMGGAFNPMSMMGGAFNPMSMMGGAFNPMSMMGGGSNPMVNFFQFLSMFCNAMNNNCQSRCGTNNIFNSGLSGSCPTDILTNVALLKNIIGCDGSRYLGNSCANAVGSLPIGTTCMATPNAPMTSQPTNYGSSGYGMGGMSGMGGMGGYGMGGMSGMGGMGGYGMGGMGGYGMGGMGGYGLGGYGMGY